MEGNGTARSMYGVGTLVFALAAAEFQQCIPADLSRSPMYPAFGAGPMHVSDWIGIDRTSVTQRRKSEPR